MISNSLSDSPKVSISSLQTPTRSYCCHKIWIWRCCTCAILCHPPLKMWFSSLVYHWFSFSSKPWVVPFRWGVSVSQEQLNNPRRCGSFLENQKSCQIYPRSTQKSWHSVFLRKKCGDFGGVFFPPQKKKETGKSEDKKHCFWYLVV